MAIHNNDQKNLEVNTPFMQIIPKQRAWALHCIYNDLPKHSNPLQHSAVGLLKFLALVKQDRRSQYYLGLIYLQFGTDPSHEPLAQFYIKKSGLGQELLSRLEASKVSSKRPFNIQFQVQKPFEQDEKEVNTVTHPKKQLILSN